MPRRKKWLPDNVSHYRDRHGKLRFRYRKTGRPDHHFKSEPGTPEFAAELVIAEGGRRKVRSYEPFSMDDLAHKLFASPRWAAMKDSSQYTYRRVIERYLEMKDRKGRRYGDYNAKLTTVAGLDRHIARLSATPGSATTLRKALKMMFRHAVKLNWMKSNPVLETDPVPVNTDGWHTWTDVEIERYRAHWPYGTMARLTLELALNTAARRCNLSELERDHLVSGRWEIAHVKENHETSVPISREARAAIEALPAAPIRHFITSAKGEPYSIGGLGNRFNKWAKRAGCPTNIHGLRKARSRQLAEKGATPMEGRAVTGHKKDATFMLYAAKADRRKMADAAHARLDGEPYLANPEND